MNNPNQASDPTGSPQPDRDFRREAQEILRKRGDGSLEGLGLEEARCLVHELQVRQIELELQNEELRRRQEASTVGTPASPPARERLPEKPEPQDQLFILESLNRINQAIRQTTDPEEIMKVVLREVRSIFDCDRAWLGYPCDPDAPCFQVPVESSRPEFPGAAVLKVVVPVDAVVARNMRAMLASEEPLVLGDGEDRESSRFTTERFSVRSQMLLAIYPRLGQPWALGIHQCSHPRRWEEREKNLFKEIGRRIADGLGFVLSLRDLRKSEEKFRIVFERAPIGLVLLDTTGRVMDCNQCFENIFGSGPERFRGVNLLEKTSDGPLKQALIDTIADSQPHHYEGPCTSIATDRQVEISLTLEKLPSNHIIAIIMDTTDRKKAEEEQMHLQDQLNQARKLESIGRLAGGIAHDFNNMLGIILGHAELALRKTGPGQPLQFELEKILKAAQHSADLTSQLLAFARKQVISPQILDLTRVVEDMLPMLRRVIGENIDLRLIAGKNLWPVRMDRSQVEQILVNLCTNARDSIRDVGTISIETMNTTVEESRPSRNPDAVPGDYIILSIGDTGCGMDPAMLENIFEPFFTTKEMGKGTGLGLAMVYGIVKQNLGFIDVFSVPGKGTSLSIHLPRFLGGQVEAPEPDQKTAVPRGHETILLVEDNPDLLTMTAELLESEGYRVLAANTPEEAIRLATEYSGRIQLLLSDVIMPKMNGPDLAKLLLEISPTMKQLFVSGYPAEVLAGQGRIVQSGNFLQKPFLIGDLTSKLREILDGPCS